MAELESIIAAHPFWKGLPADLGRRLADSTHLISLAPGAILFEEGGGAQHLHLLRTGRVVLEAVIPIKGPTVFKELEAGSTIGWSWLVPPHQWQFTARAVAASEIIVIDAEAVRAVAEEHPAFGRDLVGRMAEVLVLRLEVTRQRLKEVHASAHARQTAADSDS